MTPYLSTAPITIELIGSYVAKHVESETIADQAGRKNRGTTKSPIPVLCRMLLAMGLEGTSKVHIIRKAVAGDRYIPVFKGDRELSVWAGLDCIENERRVPHIVQHRPFSVSVEAADSQDSPAGMIDHPEGASLKIAANGNMFPTCPTTNAA